jgi:DNA polymerase III subunit chi
MTQVLFLTGVNDKVEMALRLLRKKRKEGGRVVVLAPLPILRRLDQALWSNEAQGFDPHVWCKSAPSDVALELTPVWLSDRPVEGLHCDSAINLGVDAAPWLTQGFEKVAEVVGLDADDRQAGRARWKAYEAAGLNLNHLPQTA